MTERLKFKRIGDHTLPLPGRATEGSAGFDMRTAERVSWKSTGYVWHANVSLGFAVEIPFGYEGQCRPRSGLAAKSLVSLTNAPGTIDSDYRGELRAMLLCHANVPPDIECGDRICQLIIHKLPEFEVVEVDALSETTRGASGFGNTGTR